MARLIIEVVDTSGKIVERHKLATFPVRIGRAYSNDVIISDPHVHPDHLLITEGADGWLVQDIHDGRQTTASASEASQAASVVTSGEEVVIGKTRLRFFAPHHPVAPALPVVHVARMQRRAPVALLAWSTFILTGALLLCSRYLETFVKIRPAKMLAAIVPALVLILAWAGIWWLIGFSAKRRSAFHAQLTVSNLFVIAATLYGYLLGYANYAINNVTAAMVLDFIGYGLFFGCLLFGNLAFATSLTRVRLLRTASLAAVALVLVVGLVTYANKPEFKPSPSFPALLKPPYAKIVPSRSITAFLDESRETFRSGAQSSD